MNLTEQQRAALGVALNEADLLGLEVDQARRVAAATFRVLTLPESGPPPEDSRLQFIFQPVGRLAASLRRGSWDDTEAEVIPFDVEELLGVVESFGGQPVYGWEFFDLDVKDFATWSNRLSVDWQSGDDGRTHTITLFQEGSRRHLDLCVWFDSFEIRDPSGQVVSIDRFCDGGKRWWDGLFDGDARTDGHGIGPLESDG